MRTHVTTYADHAYAVADPHLRRNWSCECRVLLGRPHAAASGSGRLHLGDPCRAASPSGEESIRYASRAISAHGCVVWIAFRWLRPEVAAALFYGISSALLALGLTRQGYARLLIFLAYPYWAGMLTAQWTPLIAASAFFPMLLPATLAKPQIGLPVALTHVSWRGVLACLVFLLLTLIALPSWPLLWIHQFGYYEHFIPLLVLPGPLLILALWRYRDRDAWLLLLAAIMPQRWFFDAFILWLIPKTRREILFTAFFSWGAGIWRWYQYPHSFSQVGRWAVLVIYLPMFVVVLARIPAKPTTRGSSG